MEAWQWIMVGIVALALVHCVARLMRARRDQIIEQLQEQIRAARKKKSAPQKTGDSVSPPNDARGAA